ncbi:type IV pilus assembly protein PilA [Lachnospiraceae bacterium NE2001]|nr:type IV pilus assembly protein PilA [Lachnospiraceae bacterium NE2001]
MKNKGFSLVELIIVIAIMAILAAAIAPALIRYIDKSRRADDVAAAETLNTGAQAALANEDIYDEIQSNHGFPSTGSLTAISATSGGTFSGTNYTLLSGEVNSSCGGQAPKIKYKKNNASGWAVGFNSAGKPVVWVTGVTGGDKELQPDIDSDYK